MSNHDYAWDVNHISYKANELGLGLVEGFSLQLDHVLSEIGEMSPEYVLLVNDVLELLHGLVGSSDGSSSYDRGYEDGYEDARDEFRSML